MINSTLRIFFCLIILSRNRNCDTNAYLLDFASSCTLSLFIPFIIKTGELQEGDLLPVARPDGGLGCDQPHLPAERQGRQVRGIQVQ